MSRLDILIIEDDEIDRINLRKMLEITQAKVMEALSGESALLLLGQFHYDCILMDYKLPDINGCELVKQIRDQGIRTPIIAVTGYGDEMLVVQMMRAGANDYLPKDRVNTGILVQILLNIMKLKNIQTLEKEIESSNEAVMKNLQDLKIKIEQKLMEYDDVIDCGKPPQKITPDISLE